jgi:hypothetical protein
VDEAGLFDGQRTNPAQDAGRGPGGVEREIRPGAVHPDPQVVLRRWYLRAIESLDWLERVEVGRCGAGRKAFPQSGTEADDKIESADCHGRFP